MSAVPAPPAGAARSLTLGISATWWYTATGVLFIELMIVLVWLGMLVENDAGPVSLSVIGVGGLVWCAATVPLLLQYRRRDDTAGPMASWRGILIPVLVSIAYGVVAGLASGLWVVGALPIAQTLMLLGWPRGIRWRVVIGLTVALAALLFIDVRASIAPSGADDVDRGWWALAFLSVVLPIMTVVSLWWWDVLITLDRARAAESRLGATQERLRVATDVHDLQGHHLQVIALQLELAERLMAKDPDAALGQIRMARTSVDEARQGTRDLALRFRSVPLRDEIANAVDLLRAAGTSAESTVDAAADAAPASVLGPVIRETTTNVLRHGGGKWARLSLSRVDGAWRYEIANDASSSSNNDGSGLEGIARRAAEAGGTVEIERGRGEFTVVVTVPEAAQ